MSCAPQFKHLFESTFSNQWRHITMVKHVQWDPSESLGSYIQPFSSFLLPSVQCKTQHHGTQPEIISFYKISMKKGHTT